MLEWLITVLAMTGIGEAAKASDRKRSKALLENHKKEISPYIHSEPPKPPVRYQNKGKQMMYEVYLKEKKENPEWAAFKVKHNQYGGYVFDDTEN